MEDFLGDLWRRGDLFLRSDFGNDWEAEFFRSQRRFLPEPEPAEPGTLRIGEYWTQICTHVHLRHPYAELLWIDEAGLRYWAVPTSLLALRGREKGPSVISIRAE